MVTAKINNREIHIKTNWSDLTYGEYLAIVDSSDNIIPIVTGLSFDEVEKLSKESHIKLSSLLGFLQEIPEYSLPTKTITKETFGQKVLFQNLVKQEKDLNKLLAYIYACYELDYDNIEQSYFKALDTSFTEVYLKGLDYSKQFNELITKENELLKSEVTSEQIRAGIKDFDKFGAMNTIDTLANGDVLKYDEILKQEYSTILVKLTMNKTKNDYERRYTKILQQK